MSADGQNLDAWRPDVGGPPAAQARISERASRTIAAARVICILGVVYVHAWTGLTGPQLRATGSTPQGLLRWVLSELFGRSAVPLLGMISGWLVVEAVRKRSWRVFILGKVKTVLWPMALWNALAIVLVGGAASMGWLAAPKPASLDWVINELFALTKPNDIDVQMPFLRDLFVCMLLAPILVARGRGVLIGVCAVSALWSVSGADLIVLLRPQILFFFTLGVLTRRDDWPRRVGDTPMIAVAVPYALLALVKIWLETQAWADSPAWAPAAAGFDLIMRISAALFTWSLCWRIVAGPAAAWLSRIEPYAFLTFCSHMIILWLAGPLIGLATGPLGSPLYPVFLLAQPPLALLAALGLGLALIRIAPSAAALLSGRRLGRESVKP